MHLKEQKWVHALGWLWRKILIWPTLIAVVIFIGLVLWQTVLGKTYYNFVKRDRITASADFDQLDQVNSPVLNLSLFSAPVATKVKVEAFNQAKHRWEHVDQVPDNGVSDAGYNGFTGVEVKDQTHLYQLDLTSLWPRNTSDAALRHDVLRIQFTSPNGKRHRSLTWNFGGLLVDINTADAHYGDNQNYYYTDDNFDILERAQKKPRMHILQTSKSLVNRMSAADTYAMLMQFVQSPRGQLIIEDDDALRAEYLN